MPLEQRAHDEGQHQGIQRQKDHGGRHIQDQDGHGASRCYYILKLARTGAAHRGKSKGGETFQTLVWIARLASLHLWGEAWCTAVLPIVWPDQGAEMSVTMNAIDHLSQIISQVVAPSFVLGAVTGLISMLYSRVNVVVERIRAITAITDEEVERRPLRGDLPRLLRRTRLLRLAVLLAILSGITTTLLIVFAFAAALIQYQHIWGSAILFMVSLAFFCSSLVTLAIEGMISHTEFDLYP